MLVGDFSRGPALPLGETAINDRTFFCVCHESSRSLVRLPTTSFDFDQPNH